MDVPKKIKDYIKDMDKVDAYDSLINIMGYTEAETKHILKIITFNDLKFQPHSVVPNAIRTYVEFPNKKWISVVGGGTGLYGDGVSTFEVLSSDNEDNPLSYLSKEEVTIELLKLQ